MRWTIPAIAASLLAIGASALAAPRTEVRARDYLSAHQTLRGSMTFATPVGWEHSSTSGRYTARFDATFGPDCSADINASIRGKATRRAASSQAALAVPDATASGRRTGGAYRVGAAEAAEDSTQRSHTVYGIAVVRVARRRYGQLRIFARSRGAGCSEHLILHGSVAGAIERILRNARSNLRVVRN